MPKKLDGKKDQLMGSAKEKLGKATGNESTELKGKLQKAKANIKERTGEAQDKVADKANDLDDRHNDK